MKLVLLFCLGALALTSCTTLSNRRDLYNPSEDAGPYNSLHPKTSSPPGASLAPPEESNPVR